MKSLFAFLLAANLGLAAWLYLGQPADLVREPGRLELQIEPERFHLLSDAELARRRSQAQSAAAALAAAAAPETPSTRCVEIGIFPSETAARKAGARIAAIGLAEHLTVQAVERGARLHLGAIDAAAEAKIREILQDFPRQQLSRCVEAPAAHPRADAQATG